MSVPLVTDESAASPLDGDSLPRQSGELGKTLVLGSAFLLVFLAHYTLRPAGEGMLVKRFGAENVPLVALIRDIFALPVTLLVLISNRRSFRLSRAIISITVPCGVVLITVPFLADPVGNDFIPFVLYLASGVLVNTGQYCTWMLFTSSVVRRNWLYFTIYGCGPQLSVIASSTWARHVLANWDVGKLLWLACIIYVLAYAVIIYAMRRFACFGAEPAEVASFRPRSDEEEVSLRNVGRLFSVPYTRFLCLAILFQVIIGEAFRWKIFVQADKAANLAGAAGMLSTFFQQTGFISLAMQLFVVPLAFLFTVRRGLLIQPLLSVIVVLLLSEQASATLIFFSVATYISCEYTLNNCMREVLYIPLPLNLKVRLKSALAILIPNIGHLIGSGVVFALTVLSSTLWQLSVLLIILFWIWSAWLVTRLYSRIADTAYTEKAAAADEV